MNYSNSKNCVSVLGTLISVGDFESTVEKIAHWAATRDTRSVFFCNTHSIVTARFGAPFRESLKQADLCLPDGAPVAYLAKRAGHSSQTRVSGPDVMEAYLDVANKRSEDIFLYGSTPETLAQLVQQLQNRFPNVRVHTYSPPFRDLTEEEDTQVVNMINASGARTVWVALGCPKQELFIAEHRGRINAVMLGVGAAFAFHAGVIRRAPQWMQRSGLEWLHRLISDPKRLWKRYLITNTVFLWLLLAELTSKSARQILNRAQTN